MEGSFFIFFFKIIYDRYWRTKISCRTPVCTPFAGGAHALRTRTDGQTDVPVKTHTTTAAEHARARRTGRDYFDPAERCRRIGGGGGGDGEGGGGFGRAASDVVGRSGGRARVRFEKRESTGGVTAAVARTVEKTDEIVPPGGRQRRRRRRRVRDSVLPIPVRYARPTTTRHDLR